MVGNAVVFVLFGIFLQSGSSHQSIHCLECNSFNNSMCLDPLMYDRDTIIKNIPIVECGKGVIHKKGKFKKGAFFCRKIVQTMLTGFYPGGRVRVTRGCGWVRSKEKCYTVNSRDPNLQIHICQCFKNYCNGAAAHALLLSLMVAAIAVYVLI